MFSKAFRGPLAYDGLRHCSIETAAIPTRPRERAYSDRPLGSFKPCPIPLAAPGAMLYAPCLVVSDVKPQGGPRNVPLPTPGPRLPPGEKLPG
jgi:hypothetical protein